MLDEVAVVDDLVIGDLPTVDFGFYAGVIVGRQPSAVWHKAFIACHTVSV